MKLGTNDIGSVYLGTNAVQKVYLGTNEVWSAVDPDAQAFFDRVTTAGGSLSTTEKTAVNTLVVQMKTDGIWSSMKAIYPMVGASAAACAQNLKSSSFTGSFSTGWSFANTGVENTSSSGYFDTNCNDNNFSNNSLSFGCYSRTNVARATYDYGIYNTSLGRGTWMRLLNGGFGGGVQQAPPEVNVSNSDSRGFFQMSKNGSTTVLGYKNSSQVINTTSTTTNPTNTTFYLGALNNGGSAAFGFSDKEFSLAYIGDGLSASDMTNYYTAVQAFQTTLSRNV